MAATTERQERDDNRRDYNAGKAQDRLRAELYEIGQRYGAGKPRDTDPARRRAILADLDTPEDAAIYDLGIVDGEDSLPGYAAGGAPPKKPAGASKKKPAAKKPAAKKSGGRRRAGIAKTAARNLEKPLRDQAVSAAQIVGLVAGVLLLSAMLQTADTWRGVMRTVARGFDWLADPTTSIPYGPNHHG